jgi:hypothetical protein
LIDEMGAPGERELPELSQQAVLNAVIGIGVPLAHLPASTHQLIPVKVSLI